MFSHFFFGFSTAEEKHELVRSLKEAIKRGIKAGSNAAGLSPTIPERSRSFRRSNTSDSGASFLRANTGDGMLRRSFSHNPDEAKMRRKSLSQGDLIPGVVVVSYPDDKTTQGGPPKEDLKTKSKAHFIAPVTVGDMGAF